MNARLFNALSEWQGLKSMGDMTLCRRRFSNGFSLRPAALCSTHNLLRASLSRSLMSSACGRHDSVHAQILDHLAVFVAIVNHAEGCHE